MPSLMTCSLNYQLTVTPELRRHLRLFNTNDNKNNNIKQEVKFEIEGNKEEKEEKSKEIYLNKQELKQLLTKHQQQQKSHKDCLQKILKKSQQQYKHRRWVLSCNLITILKQIKLTNPTFDIQKQQQQQHHLLKQQLQLQQQQHLLKI